MGCETCITTCPAIIFAAEQSAAIDENLSQIAQREAGRQGSKEQWGQHIRTAVESGQPIDEMLARKDNYDLFSSIARSNDWERARDFKNQQTTLQRQAQQRQTACEKGPRDGFMGSGIGDIVCRSAITEDGLPNSAPRR